MVGAVSWLPALAPDGATPFERAFGLRPNLHAAWRDFVVLFWERRLLDPTLLELLRIRIGSMLGAEVPDLCEAMRAARAALDPGKARAVEAWWHSGAFSEPERAVLRFAEQFVLDAGEISDAEASAVVASLGEPGTVALVELLAILDGFSRFARILGLA
jgi:alkylhydroperoxidase family enzyme